MKKDDVSQSRWTTLPAGGNEMIPRKWRDADRRLPSRTDTGAHGVLPWDAPGTGSERAPHDVIADVSVFPSQPLIVKVLRRPIESTTYLSMRYTDRLADAGIAPSVGSRGDAYDNALTESVIGLFKTEVIRRLGPWRSLEAVELSALAWV